jgi:lipid II:glycine glycyltransferase (peptidoglycan interpeptide bridge formation enzyme)
MTPPPTIVDDFDDRERWNTLIRNHHIGHFFQSWEWGELQADLGGRPRRIAAVADGVLVGGAQVLLFDASRRFAYVPRGPVADWDDEDLVDRVLDAVMRVGLEAGVDFLRIEPQWEFSGERSWRFEQSGFTRAGQFIMPRRTLLVDLAPSLSVIWDGFHSNTRNRIRLAEKRGVQIRVGCEEEMPTFIHLLEETESRHGLRHASTGMFLLAARLFGRRDAMRLYLASCDGVDLAGIIVFLSGTTATYLWGASSGSEGARRLNPNQLLHWTAMKWAKERNCIVYDLFGIPDHDADVLEAEYPRQTGGMWNLYKFKRGFGGTVHRHLGTFDWVFRRA